MTTREIFLIVEPQILVQLDLSQAILEVCPRAEVLSASSLEQGRLLLDRVPRLTGAIIGTGMERLKASRLSVRIEALGGWIICLNGRHAEEIRAEGWHPLTCPFSSDDAHGLLGRLLERETAPAAH